MRPNLRMLGKLGLALLLVSLLVVSAMPPAPASAATGVVSGSVRVQFTTAPYNASGAATDYTIHFTPTTALKRNVDTITVWFPDGSSSMGPNAFSLAGANTTVDNYLVDRDGEASTYSALRITSSATLSLTGYRVTVKTPVDMSAGVAGSLHILTAAGIVPGAASATSAYKVQVSTSKDTTPTLSEGFYIDDTGPAAVDLSLSPATAGTAGQYSFTLNLTGKTAVTVGGTVTVIFPSGTTIPATIAPSNVRVSTDGGTVYEDTTVDPVINQAARSVTITTPLQLDTDALNVVRFLATANILNPTAAAAYTEAFASTSVDRLQVKENGGYTVTAGSATKVLVGNSTALGRSDNATMINMYSSQIYLTLADTNGNSKYPGSSVTVNLSSSSSTGAFYTNAATDGSDAWTLATSITVTQEVPNVIGQIVYYKDTTAGAYTLTFSATSYTSATWTFTVAAAVSVYDSNGNLVKTYAPSSGTPRAETGDNSPSVQAYGADYINTAITAAVAGDTVKLGDGIYEMDNDSFITLNKGVTLTSVNGASATSIRNTVTIDKAIDVTADGSSTTPIIIDGLTFQRLRSGVDIHIAVRNLGNNYVTVRNNAFNNIEPSASTTNGQAVVFFNNADAITSATVSGNTFNNSVTTWPDMGSGAKSASIAFDTAYQSVNNAMTGVTISGNTLSNSGQYGIVMGGWGSGGTPAPIHSATISDNTITNGISPIDAADYFTSLTIKGNTITGAYYYGIKVEGANNTLVKIKNNTITDTAGSAAGGNAGIDVDEDTAGIITIQYNDITGSNGYAIRNRQTSKTQDAKYNYYGSASGPGTSVTSGLTTSPWLYVSKATVVTDNASYQAVKMNLVAGWNTLSTPVKLIAAADAIDELITSGLTVGYYYSSGTWTQITSGYVLNPGDAVYLKMSAATTVYLKFDASAFTNPSKSLVAGWNLIGLASLQSSMAPDAAVASVKTTATNLPGYSQVVSPSVNSVQTDIYGASGGDSWTYSSGQTATSQAMKPGLGYWIYMQNAATLAGFEITPLVPNLN